MRSKTIGAIFPKINAYHANELNEKKEKERSVRDMKKIKMIRELQWSSSVALGTDSKTMSSAQRSRLRHLLEHVLEGDVTKYSIATLRSTGWLWIYLRV